MLYIVLYRVAEEAVLLYKLLIFFLINDFTLNITERFVYWKFILFYLMFKFFVINAMDKDKTCRLILYSRVDKLVCEEGKLAQVGTGFMRF